MGQEVHQDWAITLPVMHALVESLEQDWISIQSLQEQERVTSIGAYALIAFCGSFRGSKVFLVDLFGLQKYLTEPLKEECVIIPLLERFEGENGEWYHLTPLASCTSSGLPVKQWVECLAATKEKLGLFQGPVFGDTLGRILKPKLIEIAMIDKLQHTHHGLISLDIDIFEEFGISRSFQRGAMPTACTRGVQDKHMDLINRWQSFKNARGRGNA
jgi:hypothetical protein